MVKKIENNDMKDVLNDDVAVLDFSATWCGPCKMLAPVIDELAEDMQGKAAFYSVDVDENPILAQQFGVMSVPSLFLIKDGKVVSQNVGFQPKQQLKNWIEE